MEGLENVAEKAKGLPIWVWALGGGAVLFLLAGRRGGGSSAPSTAAVISGEQALAEQFLVEEQAMRLRQQSALNEMELARATQQFNLETLIGNLQKEGLERQMILEQKTTEKVKSLKPGRIKCPVGRTTIDPATGQVYCRQEQHKGGVLPVLGDLGTLYRQFLGGGLLR